MSFADFFSSSSELNQFSLVNHSDNFRVDFSLGQDARLWCWPVYTVSQSESGLERTYQGSSLVALWSLPGGAFTKELVIDMRTRVYAV